MTALQQPASPALDLGLRLDVGMSVVRGDVVLDAAGRGHKIVRTVLTPGRMRLVAVDGWVEVVGVGQVVAIVEKETLPCSTR